MRARIFALLIALLIAFGGGLNVARAVVVVPGPSSQNWTMVVKTSNETITSDNTLSADNTLAFSLAASTKYRLRLSVFYSSGATPDFKWQVTGPASPTELAIRVTQAPANGSVTNYRAFGAYASLTGFSMDGTPSGSTDDSGFVWMEGVIHNGSNAGPWSFEWAQNTSDASNTSVLAGSYLEYKAVP